MVLQRDAKTKVWGWAAPSEKVSLKFNNKQYSTTADKAGNWTILLPPQVAGGPHEMVFSASNAVTVKDILFGDVWICSGQSNMELPMARVSDKYAEIIAKADNPHIRQFEVQDKYNFKGPNKDLQAGQWISVNAKDIYKFSAVAYFFANDLYTKYKIPIGLINSALGGSPAEAWISKTALKSFPAQYQEAQKFKDDNLIAQIEESNRQVNNSWHTLLNQTDAGVKQKWSGAVLNDADWSQMNIPGYWADDKLGAVNGSVWFRKEVNVPKTLMGKPAKLLLGRIVDADSVFINGVFVGTTSYQYPPRKYPLQNNIIKEGKNIIAVRVISQSGKGGFVPDKPYKLVLGQDSLDLTGLWKYKLGAKMEPVPGQTTVRWKPTGLFNAMIAPLLNYSIKGVVWYQGESNTDNPGNYTNLMKTLIQDWRTRWNQGNFPFIMVQLANFMETSDKPTESNWATLRQAQLNTLAVPNTGLAVAIDAGEWNDIHPLNKQTIGKRLALQAMNLAYNDKKVIPSGPIFKSVKREDNKLIISFAHTGSGLVALGNKELKYFAISGEDKKFVWAKAEIKGNQVFVWQEGIANPVTVRYAWADNPEGANLYNTAQLPASPFEASIKSK
ncbi:sialate O-acetylesterase [Adhaeribacter rhizoryzae]|nr:sialate O-acetylesterase [Adhaeribacter rhizoryzae]